MKDYRWSVELPAGAVLLADCPWCFIFEQVYEFSFMKNCSGFLQDILSTTVRDRKDKYRVLSIRFR